MAAKLTFHVALNTPNISAATGGTRSDFEHSQSAHLAEMKK